jgi:hypothetical protein
MQLYAENPERFAENLMNRSKTCAITPPRKTLIGQSAGLGVNMAQG